MATRMYMRAATAAPVSPTFSASWTASGSAVRRALGVAASGSDTLAGGSTISWTSGQVALDRQFVSGPLRGGQTISGTFTGIMRVRELDLADNVTTRVGVRVVSADGATVRATLLSVGHHGTGLEFATGFEARILANAQAIASYTTQPGDRIVVEVGYGDTAGTTPQGNGIYGSSATLDLDLLEAAAARNGWIEFSADLQFLDGSGIPNRAERGPDTIFFGRSNPFVAATLATDVSGNQVNLTAGTTWISKLAHNDARLRERFAIEMAFGMSATSSGYLFSHNGSEGTDLACVADGSGELDFYVNGSLVGSVATDVQRGTTFSYMQWSMEPNPLTTGAGNARRHDVRFYNADTGLWFGEQFTSAAPHTGTFNGAADTDSVFGARLADGTTPYSESINMVRLGAYHHPVEELVGCFLDVTAPSTWPRLEVPVTGPPALAGPVHLLAAASAHQNDCRLWGPVVNEVLSGEWAEDSTRTLDDPDNAGRDMHFELLRWAMLPPNCQRVRIRVHVQQNDASPDRLNTRVYIANAPGPLSAVAGGGEYIVTSHEIQRNADDGTGLIGGAWLAFGEFDVPRDGDGITYFWVGFQSSCPDYRARAIAIEPVVSAAGIGVFGA